MQIEMYQTNKLNLTEFIRRYSLSMILNNELIRNDSFYFEYYNYEELNAADEENTTEEIKDELNNYNKYSYTLDEVYNTYYSQDCTMEELLTMDEADALDELQEAIIDYCQDFFYEWNGEIYQYFIIPEEEVRYWEEYTSYPILYDDSTDIYLLGITHYGMSWSFFFTDADRPEYMKIEKYDEILKARAATAEGGK